MPLIRYRSPDASAFVAFDQSRFRVEHGLFDLWPDALARRLVEAIDLRSGWNLPAMKLVEEDRRLRSCLEWLESLPGTGDDEVLIPDLRHQPAIDLVADHLIGDGQFERVLCPPCETVYEPARVRREPWEFEEDGITIRGRQTLCPGGHAIHVVRDHVDVPGIELPDD